MNFKRQIVLLGSCMLLLCTGTVSVVANTVILDNLDNGKYGYVGKSQSVDSYGGSNFDITKMVVSRSGEQGRYMNVTIYTNFAGQSGDLYSSVQYGDLLLSTDWQPAGGEEHREDNLSTSGTRWEYAYGLDDRRDYNDDGGQGRLYELNSSSGSQSDYVQQFNTSDQVVGNGSRSGHAVTIDRGYATQVSEYNRWVVGDGFLSFSFDLLGTKLLNSDQIAFHWAMTCANDVIEGQVDYGGGGGGGEVAEPDPSALLLLGFGALYLRKRQLNSVLKKVKIPVRRTLN